MVKGQDIQPQNHPKMDFSYTEEYFLTCCSMVQGIMSPEALSPRCKFLLTESTEICPSKATFQKTTYQVSHMNASLLSLKL